MNKEQIRLAEITKRMDSLNSKNLLSDSEEKEFNNLNLEANKLLRQLEANSIKDALNEPVDKPDKGYLIDTGLASGPIRAFDITQKEELRKAIRAEGKGNIENPGELRFGRAIKSLITGEDCPEKRAIGTTGTGNYLIQDELASQIIPEILAETRVVQAGALTVPIGQATQTIAKVSAGPDTEWKEENQAYSGGENITFTGITLSPKVLFSLVVSSQELISDGLDMERNIESILSKALANEVDRVALEGGAVANEPTGIVNTDDVLTEVYDSTYDCFSDAFYAIQDENIAPSGLIIPSAMMKTLDQLREDGASGAYLAPPKSWEEYRKFISNQIDQAVMGNFRDLIIGSRTQLTVEVSKVAEDYWKKLQVGIRAYLRIDIAVKYPKSFCVISSASS